ncbi:glycoside hydrolase family 3 N-terminal domain-containing protein [Arthrobacter rhombi]|uniref:glycoside hydrolase family 3 N-terminal domain-containing protein n=1 Tax=Arthrobacter rhombi TaxID=71253 RepID=UPI003FD63C32
MMKKHLRNVATAALICAALPLAACTTPEPGPASSGSAGAASSGASSEGTGSPESTSAPGSEGSAQSSAGSASPSSPPETPAAETAAQKRLDTLSLEQRVGQVLMMGVPAAGATAADLGIVQKNHVGNVFLKGRSAVGLQGTAAAVQKIEDTVTQKTTGGVGQFISTDQEGGKVQVLKGPGYSTIPAGLTQGSWDPKTLERRATGWGKELAESGINVNLAPVADTVPASIGAANAPIGAFGREYGKTPGSAQAGSSAFAAGMDSAGVSPVMKHYPGLGRVSQNTDVSHGVTDTVTTRDDESLEPFQAGIDDGADFIMLSSAYYSRIDAKNPAAFSDTVINGMLREDQGFDGIVISDDMCDATQFRDWKYATRAKKFFDAGGTMMLCVNQDAIGSITAGLVAEAKADPGFKAKIDAAALLVLKVKDGL